MNEDNALPDQPHEAPASASLSRGRLHGLDVARGLAVLGMVLVNLKVALGAEARGPEWLRLLAAPLTGRAAATFVVLAGVGVTLMGVRARRPAVLDDRRAVQRRLYRRCAFLLLLGVGLLVAGWTADILHYYALYLSIAAALMFASKRVVWSVAAAAVFMFYLGLPIYERGWSWSTFEYRDLWTLRGMLRNTLFNGFHPVFPWVSLVLWGMLLGRRDLRAVSVQRSMIWGGAGLALLVEGLCWAATSGLPEGDELRALVSTGPMPPGLPYLLAGGGLATAVIGACLRLTQRWPDAWPWRALSPMGLHALTHYVAHVLLLILPLTAMGLGASADMTDVWLIAVGYGLLGGLWSYFWQRRLGRGPLSALMRRLAG